MDPPQTPTASNFAKAELHIQVKHPAAHCCIHKPLEVTSVSFLGPQFAAFRCINDAADALSELTGLPTKHYCPPTTTFLVLTPCF